MKKDIKIPIADEWGDPLLSDDQVLIVAIVPFRGSVLVTTVIASEEILKDGIGIDTFVMDSLRKSIARGKVKYGKKARELGPPGPRERPRRSLTLPPHDS